VLVSAITLAWTYGKSTGPYIPVPAQAGSGGEIFVQKDKRDATSIMQHFDQNFYQQKYQNFFFWASCQEAQNY
jgi:hypothetical protein